MHRIFILMATLLSAHYWQSAYAQTPASLPIEYFTKYDEFGGIKLSPTGEYAAYMTGKYGRSMVAFISIQDKKITGGVRCPEGFEIYDFDWVSNTRIVYRIAERQPGMIQPTPTGEMLAIDYDGKRQKFIYGYRAGTSPTGTLLRPREASYATPEIITPFLAEKDDILIAEHPWREGSADMWYDAREDKPLLTQLDTYTGKKKSLGRAPLVNATILVDSNEAMRFAIGWDDRLKLAVSWRKDPQSDWAAFNLPGFREETVIPQLVSADNQSVIFTGARDNESLHALYSVNVVSNEIQKLHGFGASDVTDVVLDFSAKKVVGVTTYTDKPQVHWLNNEDQAAKIYRALYRAFPEQTVKLVSSTKDGRIAVAFVSSDVNPGDYFLFDTQTMKADYLQSAKRWIEPKKMRRKEAFTMKAREGVDLHGYITRPAGDGPYPLVVLPHGGPHGVRDRWGFDWEVQLLANRGYAVLQVNFRGSGGYGEEFQSRGYKEWGASMQDDVTDATHWAIDQKITQADRICIYGASYGGYAALQGAVREPALYRCAIGYAGVYDLELMLTSADVPYSKKGLATLQTYLGNDRNRLRAYSPVHHADKIQVPVLLIHGKEDFRADFEHAKRMKAALEKNNKQFEWRALSREGHGVYDEETRREVYEHILSFLARHLKTGSAAQQ